MLLSAWQGALSMTEDRKSKTVVLCAAFDERRPSSVRRLRWITRVARRVASSHGKGTAGSDTKSHAHRIDEGSSPMSVAFRIQGRKQSEERPLGLSRITTGPAALLRHYEQAGRRMGSVQVAEQKEHLKYRAKLAPATTTESCLHRSRRRSSPLQLPNREVPFRSSNSNRRPACGGAGGPSCSEFGIWGVE